MTNCGCILLAAGASTRLGSPKQLLRMNGETLLHRSARFALEAGLSTPCVVLGSNAEQHKAELVDLSVEIVLNPDWQSGMSSSLRAGISRLTHRPQLDRAIVLVCDQVGLSTTWIRKLLATSKSQPQQVIASFYRNHAGVPCIFPSIYFRELTQIDGDHGARLFLQKHASELVTLPFPEGDLDVDTPADKERFGLAPYG